ncbi:tRNA preQ1(34) S-adenosylmethionine ribosyltransferase-isomerase QueA [Patescibacteria group bacterium]|nr:tRNA preQ1(34) S-adenosylmethionine ribosyltransferase-isomerase QueA [Patescibacteria group bacterium]
MKLSLFDYHLPSSLIAQSPTKPRDHSRLLVYNRSANKIQHDHFYNLPDYLKPGDVLVFNNTKVFPARLQGRKTTGGKIEVFLLKPVQGKIWEVLIGGRVRHVGQEIKFSQGLQCQVASKLEHGLWQVKFNKTSKEVLKIADKIGSTPTPPYIKKKTRLNDYQTVYAKKTGSVAAPTAGFHFTKSLLKKLKSKGVQFEYITLHVGFGTFQPVKVNDITKHTMHAEFTEVDSSTAKRLVKAKKQGQRIIAVGTTSVRTLEAVFTRAGHKSPANPHTGFKGWINPFIYPGYKFMFIDGMITNFHLPKSTLLMLISAFIGRKKVLDIYKKAIKKKYRFYSFGDGMLIY